MKKSSYILSALGILLVCSCSTKKNSFINRNWHALNTKYNVLFNGNNALEDGKATLLETYKDDYWEILPVERMEIKEEIVLPGTQKNANFERAEEKATKAIQKRSMNINDRERNPQTDESFLLLGKARYYDQRFIPALEAFNYILYKYPDSDKIGEAKVWREKVNIRLENEEVAIKNLKRLLRQEDLKDQTYADAKAMMAQAYINLKSLDSAVTELRIAEAYTRDNEEKGRYNYIIGQLYNQLGHKDSANMAFDNVIELNRKSPRIYMINAYLEKAANFDPETQDKALLFETLTELEENRENRPFLDRIFRQIALYHLDNDSIDLAVNYFNKSLRKKSPDRYLNALNYENLAILNFDASRYKEAGAYYDSTLTNLKENTRKYRRTFKKRQNLEDVIKYEGIAQENDSIIYLVNLPEAERTAYFETYIAELIAREEALKKEQEEKEAREASTGIALSGTGNNSQNNKGDKFYFYNNTTVSYGKNEFRQRWGDRVLEDNWRLSDKTSISEINVVAQDTTGATAAEDLYKVATYLNQLPSDPQKIDSIVKERDFAYYQLGLIYKEKYKEYDRAADKLETLLANKPEEKLVLPAKYNLYKIYQITNNETGAFNMKREIITNHPNSRYAEILQNPEAILSQDANSPEALYTALYKRYEAQEYEEVIQQAEKHVRTFTGEDIAPKFEMLKTNAEGKLYGFESYKKGLNYIALNYPNNIIGKEAQRIAEDAEARLANPAFVTGSDNTKWKLIFPLQRTDTTAVNKLLEKLTQAVKDQPQRKLKLSKDIYDPNMLFVVVHGLLSSERALGFAELLKNNKDYRIRNENFVILSKNYKTVQVHKNLEAYLEQSKSLNP
ncbi:tetratricopeptide repeat protein [Flavobacteriaceae bacterium M23B6Z8]